jgi:flagellar basal body-associated protein FliL
MNDDESKTKDRFVVLIVVLVILVAAAMLALLPSRTNSP